MYYCWWRLCHDQYLTPHNGMRVVLRAASRIPSSTAGCCELRCAFGTLLNPNPCNELLGAGGGIAMIGARASLVSLRHLPKVMMVKGSS